MILKKYGLLKSITCKRSKETLSSLRTFATVKISLTWAGLVLISSLYRAYTLSGYWTLFWDIFSAKINVIADRQKPRDSRECLFGPFGSHSSTHILCPQNVPMRAIYPVTWYYNLCLCGANFFTSFLVRATSKGILLKATDRCHLP